MCADVCRDSILEFLVAGNTHFVHYFVDSLWETGDLNGIIQELYHDMPFIGVLHWQILTWKAHVSVLNMCQKVEYHVGTTHPWPVFWTCMT